MAKRRAHREQIGPLHNIRREPEGWSVVVIREGVRYSDYFGDAVYGGRSLALIAAQRYRDDLLRRIDPETRVRRQMPRGVTSETDIVGVTLELPAEGCVSARTRVAFQPMNARTAALSGPRGVSGLRLQ